MRTGLRVGLVAAAATAGVIVGMGLRHDTAFIPFTLYGRSVLASRAGLLASTPLATAVGLLLHAFWMVLWGVCFSVVAAQLRGVLLVATALIFSAALWGLSATILPSALGAGTRAEFSAPQTLFLSLLLALSLATGMRFARYVYQRQHE